MKNLRILVSAIFVAAFIIALAQDGWWKKKGETISTATLATSVGEAYLVEYFGKMRVDRDRPLQARRMGPEWVVSGSLPLHTSGGVVVVVLSAKDGSVVSVSRGK